MLGFSRAASRHQVQRAARASSLPEPPAVFSPLSSHRSATRAAPVERRVSLLNAPFEDAFLLKKNFDFGASGARVPLEVP